MSSQKDHHSRSVVEHGQREQEKRDRWSRQALIKDTIDKCSRALGRGGDPHAPDDVEYYRVVNRGLSSGFGPKPSLVQLLARQTDRPLRRYATEVVENDRDKYPRFDRYLDALPQGFGPETSDGRVIIRDAFDVLVAIAEAEEIVEDELRNRADAQGFTLKVGEHLQDWSLDLGDPVETVTTEAGTLKTLFFGGTGQGKSTGLETEAEDYYQQNFREGADYKLIDLVGLRDGENWFYDIPQQQSDLRRIREDMDLPPDFAASDDYGTPQVEILAPLTPGLTDRRLPYDTDDERFVVRPYAAAASDLSKSLLVSLMMSRVSDQEENTIRQAYDDVDSRKSDWALKDLARAIMARDELQPKNKENAVGVLRSLQSVGFIRTKESEYALDWRDLFTDTETITVFTQAFIDSEIGRFMAVAHVVDALLEEREQMYGVPDAVLIMRELWEVTPHKGRQRNDERLASIQQTIGDRITKIQRQNRHYGVHFLADTQWPSDLHISVRKNFNRYVAYGGNRDTIKNVFDWTQNGKNRTFYNTLSPEAGMAGVVGQVQPAIDEREIEFISPVKYAPPSHHHKDRVRDDNGWRARAKYLTPTEECAECGGDVERIGPSTVECLECEEQVIDYSLGRNEDLRRPASVEDVSWPGAVPEQLQLRSVSNSEEDDEIDVDTAPVRAFVEKCLQPSSEYVFKADAHAAFNAFLEDHGREPWDFDDHGATTRFGDRAKEGADWPLESARRVPDGSNEREMAYIDTKLTQLGTSYLEEAGV